MVTAIYAVILTIVFLVLSVRTLGFRRKLQVSIGDDGNKQMLRAIRVHGNFSEYAPLALVLMLLTELQNAPLWMVHLLGVLLVSGRLIHAIGVSQESENFSLRVTGMSLTFGCLISACLFICYLLIFSTVN